MHGHLNTTDTRPVKQIIGRTLQRRLRSIPRQHRELLMLGLRAGTFSISHLTSKQAAALMRTRR
jgi:hypothetical protein